MSITRERRVKELFVEALALDCSAREGFLAEVCGALRGEVEALLDAERSMGDFLSAPAARQLTKPLPPGAAFAGYEIVRVLGAGGAGTVYEAIQQSPRRRVALKVMHAGLSSPASLRRFRDEAEILARLKHPGIAHVYAAGVAETVPWFALEYVESARHLLDHGTALDRRQRLDLFARLCDAVHHGHLKGIVHRDLKPGNVLVDEAGRPKVIDFGIARATDLDAPPAELAGTLPYMSPEQCRAGPGDVDSRTDVYSLGVLLYELLTGRLPLDLRGRTLTDAVRLIRESPPIPIESVDRSLRGDVAAIVGKALAKDPDRRYASAAALGDDIRRHLGHHPVEAHAPSILYQWRKFARRQRVGVGALTAIVALSVAFGLVNRRLATEREGQRRAAEYRAYLADLAAASAALEANDVATARRHLERAPAVHRNWEWRHLAGRLDLSGGTWAFDGALFDAAALSPDRTLVVASSRGDRLADVTAWDATLAEVRFTVPARRSSTECLSFSPDGTRLAVGRVHGGVDLHDGRTGVLLRASDPHEGNVTMIAFAPDGARFATSSYDGTVKVWETATGRPLADLASRDRAFSVAFDPQGRWLVAGTGSTGALAVWDATSLAPSATIGGHDSNVEDLAFRPDGQRLVSVSMDRTVRVWDTTRVPFAPLGVLSGHDAGIKALAFAPDGRTFATSGTDRTVRLWDGDGRELACFRGHTHYVYSVAYLDAHRLLTFSLDGTARTWETGARDVPSLAGHGESRVLALAFDGLGRRLASLDEDGGARLWDLEANREIDRFALAPRETAWRDQGKESLLLFRYAAGGGALFLPGPPTPLGFPPRSAVAAGGLLFACAPGGRAEAWRTTKLADLGDDIVDLATDAAGRTVAGLGSDGTVTLWRANPFARIARHPRLLSASARLAPAPDGRIFAAAVYETGLSLFDGARGTLLRTLSTERGMIAALAFSPDGTRLATAAMDGTIRLWDPATGELVLVLRGYPLMASALAWSPDGRTLATAGGGWAPGVTIRLWQAR